MQKRKKETWAKRLRAKQSKPARAKKGSQCSAQHQAAWKLPCTITSAGGFELAAVVSALWEMTSRASPEEGSRWKPRDCPSLSS